MQSTMFSRLMKRIFANEYAAMQREYDIDTTEFPLEPVHTPMASPLAAPMAPATVQANSSRPISMQ